MLAAEAALAGDREMDKRELAQRLAEAQGAVRKLQSECEHQVRERHFRRPPSSQIPRAFPFLLFATTPARTC